MVVKNRANPTGDRLPLCLNFYCELLKLSEDRGGFDPMNYLDRSEIRDFSVYFKDGVGYCCISLERLFALTDEEKGIARLGKSRCFLSELSGEMEENVTRNSRKLREKYSKEEIKPIILSTPMGMSSLLVDYEGNNPYLEWYTMYWNITRFLMHELDLMNTGRYSTAHDSIVKSLMRIYDILVKLKGIAQYFAYERIVLLESPKFPEEISEKK
jgi:predicted metal-dependent peptidase